MEILSGIFNSIQKQLFPVLEEEIGTLSDHQREYIRVVEVIRPDKFLCDRSFGCRGRPARSRTKLFNAFIAKAVYNQSSTRGLLELLHSSPVLRRLCGWESVNSIPSESTFSRAFAEFAESSLPQEIHAALTGKYLSGKALCQVSYDSSAIQARENAVEMSASMPDLVRQGANSSEVNFALIPRECSWGAKTGAAGHVKYWKGYKLHMAVTDGDIPLYSCISSASLHDSQAVIPMMQQLRGRFDWLCDLMDSAYDAQEIRAYSTFVQKRIPIIDFNRRRGEKNSFLPHEQLLYRKRSCVERVFSNLKDNFACRKILVRGAPKVMAQLMFGILALTVKQLHNMLI